MSSEIKADKWSPASGTSATIGDSGDTYTVPSGVTLNTSSATLTLPSTVITGQTEKSSLADADKFLISDSAASGAFKYVQNSNVGGGSYVKLTSGTASAAVTHSFTSFMDSSKYDTYYIQFKGVSNMQGNEMSFQFNNSSGIITTAKYWYACYGRRSGGSDMENSGENQVQASIGTALDGGTSTVGNWGFWFYSTDNGDYWGNSVQGDNWGYRVDWSDYLWGHFAASLDTTDTVTGFSVHAQGNDATTFDYSIYGIAK